MAPSTVLSFRPFEDARSGCLSQMEPPLTAPHSKVWDWLAGVALGVLLGALTGLSAAPVVSTVVTALTALLAGLFGISAKTGAVFGDDGARRLAAFALAATVAAPASVWVRTHDLLAPSIKSQIEDLEAMGYDRNDPDRRELLRFIRFGLLPNGATQAKQPRPDEATFYATGTGGLCANLANISGRGGLLNAMERAGGSAKKAADLMTALPADQQRASDAEIKALLCPY